MEGKSSPTFCPLQAFFTESIDPTVVFEGLECESWEHYQVGREETRLSHHEAALHAFDSPKSGDCTSSNSRLNLMGLRASPDTPGVFFLATAALPPFAIPPGRGPGAGPGPRFGSPGVSSGPRQGKPGLRKKRRRRRRRRRRKNPGWRMRMGKARGEMKRHPGMRRPRPGKDVGLAKAAGE